MKVLFSKFISGESSQFDAIDIAVTKMRKRDKCELFVKPEYAFSSKRKIGFNIPDGYQDVYH
jgi:hypothetical protein